MIYLTRLNRTPLVVNEDRIEHIEMTPDTVISLCGGPRLTVLETADEIIDKVIEFRRLVLQGPVDPESSRRGAA